MQRTLNKHHVFELLDLHYEEDVVAVHFFTVEFGVLLLFLSFISVCLYFSHHSITFSSDNADNVFDSSMRLNNTCLIIIKWQWWWWWWYFLAFFFLFSLFLLSWSGRFASVTSMRRMMMSLKFVSRSLIPISTLCVHQKKNIDNKENRSWKCFIHRHYYQSVVFFSSSFSILHCLLISLSLAVCGF